MAKSLHPFKGVLCDTSFLITLLNPKRAENKVADDYYKFFLDYEVPLFLSSIVIGEYCVRGSYEELPIMSMIPLTYTVAHAREAATIAATLIRHRKTEHQDGLKGARADIPNDSMLLGQCVAEDGISHFITADRKFKDRISRAFEDNPLSCQIITLEHTVAEVAGTLDFNTNEQ